MEGIPAKKQESFNRGLEGTLDEEQRISLRRLLASIIGEDRLT